MTQTFHLDQIKKVLVDIDSTKATEEVFVSYFQRKVVVPPVGEMLFENPPGEAHIKYGFIKNGDY